MFDTPGWTTLKKQLQEELDNLPLMAFYSAKDFEELVAYRVRARLLGEMIAFEEIIAQQKEELLLTREQEKEDEDISTSLENL
jgi:hypothetical protein